MTPDNGAHVIICRSYGDLSAYACTLDNARAIFDNHVGDLPREIDEVANQLLDTERPSVLYGAQGLHDALSEVLTKKPGEESSKLRSVLHGPSRRNESDTRPQVFITEEAQQELVLWLFKHGLSAKPLDSSLANKFNDLHPELELAFLAPFVQRMAKPIQYIRYPEYLEAAKSLKSLRANRWKDDAQEHRVVEQYLRFVREWLVDKSDTTYEVSEIAASFG
jgi:hypothetical protein